MKKRIRGYIFFVVFSILTIPIFANAKEVSSDFTLTEDITDGILVTSGNKVTIDLAGYNIKNSSGNDTIKVEKNATLTLKGNGTVSNDSNGKAPISNDGTITIESGTYQRTDSKGNSYYVILNHGDMVINGGTFKVTNGTASLIDNGWYTPSENIDKKSATLTINGGTFIMTNNDKYIKNDDYGIMSINAGTFTMEKPSSAIIANVGSFAGNETVTINGGEFNYTGTNYAIWGYAGTTKINGGNFKIANESAKISNVEYNKEIKQYPILGKENEYIVANEKELKEEIETTSLKKEEISASEIELIEKNIESGYKIAGYYNIDLYKESANNVKIEKLITSSDEITIYLKVPTTITPVAKDYKRVYFIIRIHDGKVDILNTEQKEDGTIAFKTNKFSTYVLTYKDSQIIKEENPKTADYILYYISAGSISIIALLGIGIYKKNKATN